MNRYQNILLGWCWFSCCGLAALNANPPVPFEVEILSDEAVYRSGPGEAFYACSQVARGTRVEVYQQHETGYLAIRPPEGASSWVLARDVAMTDRQGIGRVVRAKTICWIDSDMETALDDQWQVQLKADELVEILEKRAVPGEARETADYYFRIRPPSGEFRWIHPRFVGSLQRQQVASSALRQEPVQPVQFAEADTNLPTGGWRDRRLANSRPARSSLVKAVRFTQDQPMDDGAAPQQILVDKSPVTGESTSTGQPKSVRSSRAPQQESLKYRMAGATYDGVGWLMPVYGRERSLPPFALLDREGRLLQYVVPGPGVNLRRYTRKYVGILGTPMLVGHGEDKRLTAYRVIDLERHR